MKKKYDVLVCGGGPAGFSAGFSAARMGAKTMIIEQFNCLGGVATAGGHGHICLYSAWGSDERVVGGIIWEAAKRTEYAGYGVCNNSSADFEVEGMKLILEEMAKQSKTEILYYSLANEAIVENKKIMGVVVYNKNGREEIYANRIIDCTGDGDIAARAGCSFDFGEEGTALCQPVTLMFTIGGVDWNRVQKFMKEYRKKYSKDQNPWKLERIYAEAIKNGDMRPFQTGNMGWWWTPTRPDQVGVNFTHITHVDATKAEDLTIATIEGRKQAYETIRVYRKYIPGMENCYMISTPNTIGIRESRRIHGLYTLTKEDIIKKKKFDDSIGWGSFFIDIHNVSGPGMDKKTYYPEKGFKYQIPYRILVPQDIDNLLVAGRCSSCTHEALGSLRVMPQCGVMGQAAGVASVFSLQDKKSPAKINVKALQEELKKQDCIL